MKAWIVGLLLFSVSQLAFAGNLAVQLREDGKVLVLCEDRTVSLSSWDEYRAGSACQEAKELRLVTGVKSLTYVGEAKVNLTCENGLQRSDVHLREVFNAEACNNGVVGTLTGVALSETGVKCLINRGKVSCSGPRFELNRVPDGIVNPTQIELMEAPYPAFVARACVLDQGEVKCWGRGIQGLLVLPAKGVTQFDGAGEAAVCAVYQGRTSCWWIDARTAVVTDLFVPPMANVKQVAMKGTSDICALTDRDVICWDTYFQNPVSYPELKEARQIASYGGGGSILSAWVGNELLLYFDKLFKRIALPDDAQSLKEASGITCYQVSAGAECTYFVPESGGKESQHFWRKANVHSATPVGNYYTKSVCYVEKSALKCEVLRGPGFDLSAEPTIWNPVSLTDSKYSLCVSPEAPQQNSVLLLDHGLLNARTGKWQFPIVREKRADSDGFGSIHDNSWSFRSSVKDSQTQLDIEYRHLSDYRFLLGRDGLGSLTTNGKENRCLSVKSAKDLSYSILNTATYLSCGTFLGSHIGMRLVPGGRSALYTPQYGGYFSDSFEDSATPGYKGLVVAGETTGMGSPEPDGYVWLPKDILENLDKNLVGKTFQIYSSEIKDGYRQPAKCQVIRSGEWP